MGRVYSVEEADALLPELRHRLERIRDARQTMLRHAEVVRARVVDDGGGAHPGPGYVEATETLRAEIQRLAEEEIVLRDPQTGLVDFPGEREGERVWLCWLLGEERVAYWHPLDTGFAGRRPL
ncbi:MAG TPA: DUF2203 domain-containing protein [Actinomycetota bacterium]|jgi:hypothetical protein|nr:DUF2203 domain-containing protein [Actinomycetota bacterium]